MDAGEGSHLPIHDKLIQLSNSNGDQPSKNELRTTLCIHSGLFYAWMEDRLACAGQVV